MPFLKDNVVWTVATTSRGLRYIFTPKHHGADLKASCWDEQLDLVEEFSIFNCADGLQPPSGCGLPIDDEDGNLYGFQVSGGHRSHLRVIGTWGQQIAEFPVQRAGEIWHGYPVWPLGDPAVPPQYDGQRSRPTKRVFGLMESCGFISASQRKRLGKGDYI